MVTYELPIGQHPSTIEIHISNIKYIANVNVRDNYIAISNIIFIFDSGDVVCIMAACM